VAALAAVRQWEYQPSRVHGEPIASWVTLIVHFRLP
jgi:outer membrane biosynthesis protein TonB